MNRLISEILRPASFDDLVLSEEIKIRLKRMRDTKNVMNMLFYGKPGTGKTSAAKLFIDSDIFDTITINGSLETSVEDVRKQIRNFSACASFYCQQKIVFIDEADYLSSNAQAGLRKVIEDSSDRCRFIFTANELKKIQPAICSRLLLVCFDMTESQIRKSHTAYKDRVLKVLGEKHSDVDPVRIEQIIDMYYPDYRSIANHLEFEFI
jgi:replication factor C small subunit